MTKVYSLDGEEIGSLFEDENPVRIISQKEYEELKLINKEK